MDNDADKYKVWRVLGEALGGFKCNFCGSEARWVVQNQASLEKKMVCEDCRKKLEGLDLDDFKFQQLKSLVDRLREAGLSTNRFIKIVARGKNPVMPEGFYEKLLEPDDPTFIQHLVKGGNYGVAAGSGLVLIESDGEPLASALASRFKTFTVISGGSRMPHFYIAVDDLPADTSKAIPLYYGLEEDMNGNLAHKHIGMVKIENGYCVGPGSIHPSGGLYTIGLDAPIAKVAWKDLEEVLKPYMLDSIREARQRIERAAEPEKKLNISIEKVLEVYGVKGLKKSGEQLYGPHPIHGSTTGRNFWVHIGKGVWYCFRCQSGGGPVTLLAVLEGLISCDEARKGLNGELYRKCLEKAVEKGLLAREALEEARATLGALSIEDAMDVFNAIRMAESMEDIMNLIKKLPNGIGLVELVEYARGLGFIDEDGGAYALARLPVSERARVLWDLVAELDLFRFVKVYREAGDWDVYIVGKYNVLYDAEAIIASLAKRLGDFVTTRETVNELMEYVKADAKTITQRQINPVEYIALKNGILDLDRLELVDAEDLDVYFLSQLPVSVDLEFAEQLKAGKIDDSYFKDTALFKAIRGFYDDENWMKLKKALGSILAPIPLRLLVMIIGPPKTGKTTLSRALNSALGRLCSNVSLEALAQSRFAEAPFLTARVNVSVEGKDIVVRGDCVDRLKRYVGGDTLPIERKYQPIVQLEQNILKMFFMMNDLPRFQVIDEALADRILVIFTENPIKPGEEDPDVWRRVQEDRDNVFKFLLYCAWILKSERYKIERDIEETMELLEEARFPLSEWISQMCVENEDYVIEREEAYNSYVEWSKAAKPERILTRRKFYELMRTKYIEVVRKGKYYFKGLTLRESGGNQGKLNGKS
jgi:phage/plasmid-associated DNA primase